jgi:hypothetical protein
MAAAATKLLPAEALIVRMREQQRGLRLKVVMKRVVRSFTET